MLRDVYRDSSKMPLINFLEEPPHITIKPQQHTNNVFLIHPVTLGEVRTQMYAPHRASSLDFLSSGHPRGAARLVVFNGLNVLKGKPDIVKPFHQTPAHIIINLEGHDESAHSYRLIL